MSCKDKCCGKCEKTPKEQPLDYLKGCAEEFCTLGERYIVQVAETSRNKRMYVGVVVAAATVIAAMVIIFT